MISSNVRETTTTTGTGAITLEGASENGRTFSSQKAISERFPYYIDDRAGNFEEGVGYLSASTTLVREKPIDGSAALPVSFAAGTKQVFIGASTANLVKDALGFSAIANNVKFMLPFNLGRLNSTQVLVANRQYFFEAYFVRAALVDLMGVYVSTGGGTSSNKMHIGLYEVNPLAGVAGNLLIEAVNLNPSVAGLISGSVTETLIQSGLYVMSIWCDVAVTIKANDVSIRAPSALKCSSAFGVSGHDYTSSLTGLTGLPDPATVTTNNLSGGLMTIAIGHT